MLTAKLTHTLKDSCTLLTEQHHRIERSRYATLRGHGSNISGSQQTVILQIWQKKKKEKMDMHDLTVHNCIQEQKVADTFLSSFDNANDHLCQE